MQFIDLSKSINFGPLFRNFSFSFPEEMDGSIDFLFVHSLFVQKISKNLLFKF